MYQVAINRFKNVTEEYDQTIYVEEAHRLVEINYKIDLSMSLKNMQIF